jgi:hypothetical protein
LGPLQEALKRDDFELPTAEIWVPVAAKMVGDIEAVAGGPVLLPGLFRPRRPATPRDPAEAANAIWTLKREANMTIGQDARRSHQPGATRDEDGIGIAETEGSESLECAE